MSELNSGDFDQEETAGATMSETPPEQDEGNSQTGDQVDISREEERLHLQALNLIGSVLDENYKGDPKRFFEQNPDLAEKANRSKRHKEAYRALMAEEPKERKEAKPSKSISEEDVAEKAALKVYQMNLDAERGLQTQKFAETEGINIDQVDTLKRSAQALFEANKGEIPYARCLKAASLAFQRDGEKANVKVPSSQSLTAGAPKKQEFDGSPGQWYSAA